jgi:hypothetical protein
MKYTTLKTFALAGLFLLAAASVQGQSANRVAANIPFDFAAGDAKLTGGQYIIERVDMERLVITSADGKVRVFALAPRNLERARNDASERLVFQRYRDMYFLSEAWINGNGAGLGTSKVERRVARDLAKTNGKPETIGIVARSK